LRILVTGAAGRLGKEIVRVFSAAHEVYGFDIAPDAVAEMLDILDERAVASCVAGVRPDLAVHAAAYTDVDGCESDPDTAFRVNAIGTWNIAAACAKADVPVAYVSTDFVFDGEKDEPYIEFDEPNPISVYGYSKLAGEKVMRDICPKHFIIRTAWLYADGGKSFPAAILEAAFAGKPLKVVTDQVGSPTYDPDLAEGIYKLVMSSDDTVSSMFGTYHLTNQGRCSRYELAKKAVKLAGLNVVIEQTISGDYNAPGKKIARRPRNSVLRNYALELRGMELMRPWEDALAEFVGKWTTAKH